MVNLAYVRGFLVGFEDPPYDTEIIEDENHKNISEGRKSSLYSFHVMSLNRK